MESIGVGLKKLRLEKGISLEEAHKKTKIHLNILRAIEEDSLIGISPIYIKGFLKIYCKFLGADLKEYIANYQEPQGRLKMTEEASDTLEKPLPFFKNASLKLNCFRDKGMGIRIRSIFIIVFFVFLSVILFLAKFISSKRSVGLKAAIVTEKIENKKNQDVKLQRKQKDQAVRPKEKKSEAAVPKNKEISQEIRLGIRTKEDCWLHLKVDGRVVFHTILKKGKFESWQAKEKIEFSVGNAGVIELELNGKSIPSLGRKGQAIKDIVITRDEGLRMPR